MYLLKIFSGGNISLGQKLASIIPENRFTKRSLFCKSLEMERDILKNVWNSWESKRFYDKRPFATGLSWNTDLVFVSCVEKLIEFSDPQWFLIPSFRPKSTCQKTYKIPIIVWCSSSGISYDCGRLLGLANRLTLEFSKRELAETFPPQTNLQIKT